MPKKPTGGSGEAGFYRRGLPNRPLNAQDDQDDPRAFHKTATDMMIGAEKTILEHPAWGVRQAEVDGEKEGFLDQGERGGLKLLENELEKAMREMDNDRETTVRHLGLALAYLELTEGVNEDNLDVSKDI